MKDGARPRSHLLFAILFGLTIILAACQSESQELAPGVPFPSTGPSQPTGPTPQVTPVPATGLNVVATETGKISMSADGLGTNDAAGGTIQVEKPNATATVRSAHLACASNGNRIITDNDVALDGNGIVWSQSVQNNAGSLTTFFNSVLADVTSIVKPKVDAAAPGLVDFTQTEVLSATIDGCALYAIFDDPTQSNDSTIVVLFGGQDTNGETFNISLAEAIDKSDPNLLLEFSLAISFGFQGSFQASNVDVNGSRLTSSAGGFDDGVDSNGALLTVGGIGDTNANPADPNQGPNGDSRLDDELYDLIPFVNQGDTTITVFTTNPSDDDNIYASVLVLSTAAVVDEGILLTPLSATNPINTNHTVTALVQDNNGTPVVGTQVDFEVISGPNTGLTSSSTTDASGDATFTYSSPTAGTDTIVARFTDSQNVVVTSNEVTKIWEAVAPTPGSIDLDPPTATNPVGTSHTVTATITDPDGTIAGATIDFNVTSGPNVGDNSTGTTDANGQASFTYTGDGGPGTDVIEASFTDATGVTRTATAEKIWEAVDPIDTTSPTCELTSIDAGPPVILNVMAQDDGSGLATINVIVATNVVVTIPTFTPGTNDALTVTGTKIDQNSPAQLELEVIDVDGNITRCDPVIVQLEITSSWGRASRSVSDIPEAEGQLSVVNGEPGVDLLTVQINGNSSHNFSMSSGDRLEADASADMGSSNSAELTAFGEVGSAVVVMFHDGSAGVADLPTLRLPSGIGLQSTGVDLNWN